MKNELQVRLGGVETITGETSPSNYMHAIQCALRTELFKHEGTLEFHSFTFNTVRLFVRLSDAGLTCRATLASNGRACYRWYMTESNTRLTDTEAYSVIAGAVQVMAEFDARARFEAKVCTRPVTANFSNPATKPEPKPRTGSYMGMPIHSAMGSNGTWLEGEEFAYPHGGKTRRAWVDVNGTRRIVWCGIPDTFFSIPAYTRVRGKYVAGFVTSDENGFSFRAYRVPVLPMSLTSLQVWSERDRNHVELRDTRNDRTVVEWWDDDAIQAVEDGFLPHIAETSEVHDAAYRYARERGMLPTFRTVDTTWELRTYDVWGNRKDGFEVNDVYGRGSVSIACKVELNNAGTPSEFVSASPSDYQIQRVFGVRCKLETDGDDTHIYVTRASDGYPIGELTCTSHSSLSPIR